MIAFEAHQPKTICPPKLPSTLDGVSKNDAVLHAPHPRRGPGKDHTDLSPTKQWSRLSSRWGVYYSLSGSDIHYLILVPRSRIHSSQPRNPRSSDGGPSFIAVAFVDCRATKMDRTPGCIRIDPLVRPRFKLAGYAGFKQPLRSDEGGSPRSQPLTRILYPETVSRTGALCGPEESPFRMVYKVRRKREGWQTSPLLYDEPGLYILQLSLGCRIFVLLSAGKRRRSH